MSKKIRTSILIQFEVDEKVKIMPHHHNTHSSYASAIANGTAAPLGDTITSTQPSTVPNPYKTVIRVPVATIVATITLNDCVLAALDDQSQRNSAVPSEVAIGATDPCTSTVYPPGYVCTHACNARNDVEHSNLPPPVVTPTVGSQPSSLASTPMPSVISTHTRSEEEGELVVQEQENSTVYLPPATDSPTNGPVVPGMAVRLPVGSGEEINLVLVLLLVMNLLMVFQA
jgi:hypothetical protein